MAILPGQSGADERRTASEPCCAGTGDGAGGSAVVGLDPDAEMIAALLPPYPSSPLLPEPRRQQLEQIRVMNKMKRANWIEILAVIFITSLRLTNGVYGESSLAKWHS